MLIMKLKRHNSVMVKYKDLRFTKMQRRDRKEVHRTVINSLNIIGLWMAFVCLFTLLKYFSMHIEKFIKRKTTKNCF